MSAGNGLKLKKGAILPSAELPATGGGSVRLDLHRGRRNLVLFLTHPSGCAGCEEKLRELAAGRAELAAEAAELLAVVPGAEPEAAELKGRLGLPFPVLADAAGSLGNEGTLVVADRFGEIFACTRAGQQHELPSIPEIVEELAFIGVQCPE